MHHPFLVLLMIPVVIVVFYIGFAIAAAMIGYLFPIAVVAMIFYAISNSKGKTRQ